MPTAVKPERRLFPAPNSDFYHVAECLSPAEQAKIMQVRAFMETQVAPVINKYWTDDAFSF